MAKLAIFSIKPKLLLICPVCGWRCVHGKTYFKQHMKDQHTLGFNQIKFLKP